MTVWTPEAIRDLRHRLGDISQRELAHRLGCHEQAVGQWERGKRRPLPLYAAALDRLAAESFT